MSFLYKEFLEENNMKPLDLKEVDEGLIETYRYFQEQFESLFSRHAQARKIENYIIKTGYRCNAFASKIKDHYVIGITEAYPIILKDMLDACFFETIAFIGLINDIHVSDSFAELSNDSNFRYEKFMLDCSIRFTFGHEFRHIRQFNACQELSNQYLNENMGNDGFSMKKHAWEFDADRAATFEVLKFSTEEYRKLENRNEGKLKCLIFSALSSVIITKSLFYYGLMHQQKPPYKIVRLEFYTNSKSHPHLLVRMLNVFEYFYDCLSADFPRLNISSEELLKNVMGISKLYFDSLFAGQSGIFIFGDETAGIIDSANQYNEEIYDVAVNDEAISMLLKLDDIKGI
jgi:hypothetical protein